MNEWVKTFELFLEKADARMRAMRDEITREVKEEISGQLQPGPRGAKGDPGADGRDGAPGTAGDRGAPGKDGADGLPGRDGKDGVNGKDGADGAPGLDGENGVGISDILLADGELVVLLTDGSKKNVGRVVGERGPEGKVGPEGPAGPAGLRGEVGERGDPGKDGAPGSSGPEGPAGPRGEKGEPGLTGKDGSPGRDGRDGSKGDPGRDGKDGIGRKELEEEAARLLSGIRVEGRNWTLGDHTIRVPIPEYRGVYKAGDEYEAGDMVTWAGSLWHANEATKDKPGDGATAWQLVAKKGRDGKDLRSDGA